VVDFKEKSEGKNGGILSGQHQFGDQKALTNQGLISACRARFVQKGL